MFMGILCVTALLSLLSFFVFSEIGFSTFLLLLISLGGLVAAPLFSKLHIPGKKLWKFIPVICAVLAILTAFIVPSAKKTENSTYDFANRVLKTEEMILSLDEAAEETLAKLEEDYGESDRTYGLRAYLCLTTGDISEAWKWLNLISDRTSKEFYVRLEALTLSDPEKTDAEALYRLYKEAAQNHPDWGYMQRMAGISEYEKGNLTSAQYYLNNALKQDPGDCSALYYMGAIACKWGDYSNADAYFRASMENGATDQMRARMTMYMNQAKQEGGLSHE